MLIDDAISAVKYDAIKLRNGGITKLFACNNALEAYILFLSEEMVVRQLEEFDARGLNMEYIPFQQFIRASAETHCTLADATAMYYRALLFRQLEPIATRCLNDANWGEQSAEPTA